MTNAVSWLLSLDSLRRVDRAARTIERVSGVRSPTRREGSGPRSFSALVPDPPVPGLPVTVVWSIHEATKIRSTQTSAVLASWPAEGCLSDMWKSSGTNVLREGSRLDTPTPDVAHALAVLLNDSGRSPRPPMDTFRAVRNEIYAGADVLAWANVAGDAEAAVEHLNLHPAAAVLGAGLAVAADETIAGYRLMPSWLVARDVQPWTASVEAAARLVGIEVQVEGTLESWTLTGRYRAVTFTCDGSPFGFGIDLEGHARRFSDDPVGPLNVIEHVVRAIDSLGDHQLLELALRRADLA